MPTLVVASFCTNVCIVDTEAFAMIDAGDGVTNIELQFGNLLNKKLTWNLNLDRFEFNDDVHIENSLTVSGSLITENSGIFFGDLITQKTLHVMSGATLSGALILTERTLPATPDPNTMALYVGDLAGRTMLRQLGNTLGGATIQPAFFSNQVVMLNPGAGTTINVFGTTATNGATVSHPAATEVFGYMSNFATTAAINATSGTSSNGLMFFRGSIANGANGFFYFARAGVVDNTSVRLFSGLSSNAIAAQLNTDNPVGNHIGFQFTTARGDTNWQMQSKNGTTQSLVNTGMPVNANSVYDLIMFCSPLCTSVTWEIRNITAGTTAKGTIATTLPTATTAMRIIHGVSATTAAIRNFRMQTLYAESDR